MFEDCTYMQAQICMWRANPLCKNKQSGDNSGREPDKAKCHNIGRHRKITVEQDIDPRVLKETVHLQKNVKQFIFKQILYLKCEE